MENDPGDGDDRIDGEDDWSEDGVDGADDFEWTLEDLPLSGDLEATLERIEFVGDLLDEAITIPGTDYRIGLDPLLGIIPVGGDAVATVISLYIIGEAARIGVSKSTLALMIGLVLTDAVIGSIPVLGTLFDAVWKANKWNVSLLKREIDV
ncbi:DUF4112 domain-containing protein [Halalkalicoccus jeotgali]|uniref:DUF4112 domain-containing protein n=1 Tax=Halalkalicoccus jeotgali (strain DSM 18796 / CECT 7217 / JCM 14584 / KCTC 4019 / B3) TaxID=795797 RepID=D8J997_HALJB|nr:DUF4112 domain-containing protein [Halalkalicoccus jeotgali]ADJ16366.1 hypothetical protein HacjB3_14935 [Halalkalicoccus jeotgali B3]ELY37100.1 hypothetical protein C497_10163 [Halalkalicoccus jeotgali B3]